MTVLAVVSPKGGVGKTTLALNVSYSLARRGWRTLLIDGDPQGGIGLSLRGSSREASGLAEVLRGAKPMSEALLATRVPELHLLPAGRCSFASLWAWSEQLADEFMGLSGSGRRFAVLGVLVFRLENGLIADERRIYDFSGLLIQIGILRTKPGKA